MCHDDAETSAFNINIGLKNIIIIIIIIVIIVIVIINIIIIIIIIIIVIVIVIVIVIIETLCATHTANGERLGITWSEPDASLEVFESLFHRREVDFHVSHLPQALYIALNFILCHVQTLKWTKLTLFSTN